MNPRHFLKISQLVRNPPSRQRQILVAVVIGLCVLVYGIEQIFGLDQLLLEPNDPKMRLKIKQ